MNENINLTKILDGCPRGTEFYSSTYGTVTFIRVRGDKYYPIELVYYPKGYAACVTTYITKDGREKFNCNGECTFFPSRTQRDWSKFERFWDKPKGKFDPKTLQPFDKVLVRDYSYKNWKIDLFSYKNDKEKYIGGLVCLWKQCIPYNDETKHLVGTREDCPDYYKWWEE